MHYIIELKNGRLGFAKDATGRWVYPSKTIAKNTAARYLARGRHVAVHTFASNLLAEEFVRARNEKTSAAKAKTVDAGLATNKPAPAKRKTKAAPVVEAPVVRPPSDRGQGRKALQAGAESLVVPIRMTADQKAKLQALGGAQWIRECIERAAA